MKTGLLRVGNFLFWAGVALWMPFAVLLNFFWGWGGSSSPTLGAHAFLVTGTLFVPALAIVGYVAADGVERFVKAAVLLGFGVLGLAVAAALAIIAYPDYPQRGPHELIAAAMVLPAIGLPVGVIARWRRLKLPPKAWLYCSVWACLLLGAAFVVFKRGVEVELPVTVSVRRWEHSDIQDFSRYFLRADGINAGDAAAYAKAIGLTKRRGSLECGPEETADWAPPRAGEIWERDDRKLQEDRERYPEGLAGCFTRVAWTGNSLYVCEVCDWGI